MNTADSLYVSITTLDSLKNVVSSLQSEVQAIGISKNFFSSVLSIQTGIFTAVVFLFFAVSWFISRHDVKMLIQTELENITKATDLKISNEMNDIKKENDTKMNEELKDLKEDINKKLNKELLKFENDFILMEAKINRANAIIHFKNPNISYIWWLRASANISRTTHSTIDTRKMLNRTIDALNKVKLRRHIEKEMEEINTLISSFDKEKYKIEINAVENEIKRIYNTTEVVEKKD